MAETEHRSDGSQGPKAPASWTRRGFVVAGIAAVAGAGVFGARWFNITADAAGSGALTAPEAYEAAQAQAITLIDIRRPDEWQRTGIGAGAVPIDMRRRDFIAALMEVTAGRTDVPVALICARGVRSARLSSAMTDAGFTKIIDVPEGMLGSGAGPGWIKRGLPLEAWSA